LTDKDLNATIYVSIYDIRLYQSKYPAIK
jgi:hypothetical protein